MFDVVEKLYLYTSTFQTVPVPNPEKNLVNWHPVTEPFGILWKLKFKNSKFPSPSQLFFVGTMNERTTQLKKKLGGFPAEMGKSLQKNIDKKRELWKPKDANKNSLVHDRFTVTCNYVSFILW